MMRSKYAMGSDDIPELEEESLEEFVGDDEVEEGNAFGAAVTKAKEDGDTE